MTAVANAAVVAVSLGSKAVEVAKEAYHDHVRDATSEAVASADVDYLTDRVEQLRRSGDSWDKSGFEVQDWGRGDSSERLGAARDLLPVAGSDGRTTTAGG